MTDGEALQTITKAIDEYAMCESDLILPLHVLIDTLQRIERRRPGTDVTVGAIRHVLYDINDTVIRDIARQNKRARRT